MAKTYQDLYEFLKELDGSPVMKRPFRIETEDSSTGEIHITELQNMKLAFEENRGVSILLEDLDYM
jgi:hypothetical protein